MRALPGIGSHHSARRLSDEWLTPPEIIRALGQFDLDPCSPVHRRWDTATRHLTVEDDGLTDPWAPDERVWCNPPYSTLEPWMRRLACHGTGTALVFARTETRWFFEHVWGKASALLFLEGRLSFIRPDGSIPGADGGSPSVLVAYGWNDADVLSRCGLAGAFVAEWRR